MSEHTKTPWKVQTGTFENGSQIKIVAGQKDDFYALVGGTERDISAAFIVRAVNSHAELVEAIWRIIGSATKESLDQSMREAAELLSRLDDRK